MTISIRKIAVIGAGQAGRRFALRCAQSGFDVILEDVMPANLRRAEADFADLSGKLATGSMTFALTVEDAVREADIAIDFVPDELESKLEIFSLIDRMAPPKTILCTPSEALSITDLASCTYRPNRCFALRGDLASGNAIHLLHPEAASAEVLSATSNFFATLAFSLTIQADPDAPMLMKNIKSA
ncbi:3-hydroxybutyryl-CoA dehydrogenase [Granulicella aggregans]|uniref:3-hydroxybutyryl-CoA dehydrogenase n=1 Tax=Granulicella aggregans TaxID=474949 RepID=A0A7W7ZHU6_9BACT|nr:3-hydroxybutyryl-CoA dehydrogenase [Granulicella aggregans]